MRTIYVINGIAVDEEGRDQVWQFKAYSNKTTAKNSILKLNMEASKISKLVYEKGHMIVDAQYSKKIKDLDPDVVIGSSGIRYKVEEVTLID